MALKSRARQQEKNEAFHHWLLDNGRCTKEEMAVFITRKEDIKSPLVKELGAFWVELRDRRLEVIKKSEDPSDRLGVGKQVYILLANEYTGIMDAIGEIITREK